MLSCTPIAYKTVASGTQWGDVQEKLQWRLEEVSNQEAFLFRVGEEAHAASPWLHPFYAGRNFRLAWSGGSGPLGRAEALVDALRRAKSEGLDPQSYGLAAAERALARCRTAGHANADWLIDLDLLLSNAFLGFAKDLHGGRVHPASIHSQWKQPVPKVNLASLLQTALELNQIKHNLERLRPTLPGYARLRGALARYRSAAADGGWSPFFPTAIGQAGGDRQKRLAHRLHLSGDLLEWEEGIQSSSHEIDEALRRFQRRHGLSESGNIDSSTAQALSISVESRIAQLELMERWRWLPHLSGSRYVLVRIADYELDVIEDGEVVTNMRVIVGREYWRTPIFSSSVTQVTFNPWWYIPPSIAEAEILPLVRENVSYLAARQILVRSGWGEDAVPVEPASVDWQAVQAGSRVYSFAQRPGPQNPLGSVKFFFPNPFNVYLHDTPDGRLFEETRRDFSHGCIRVEDSRRLANFALRDAPGWSEGLVSQAFEAGRTQTAHLSQALPIYVMYWTAWEDEAGDLNFRDDTYTADEKLREALAIP